MHTPRKPPVHLAALHKTLMSMEKMSREGAGRGTEIPTGIHTARKLIRQQPLRAGEPGHSGLASQIIADAIRGSIDRELDIRRKPYLSNHGWCWRSEYQHRRGMRQALKVALAYEEAGLCKS